MIIERIPKRFKLVQGTPEWHAFRAAHYGASEAAVMLGLSKDKRRDELLKEKKLGITPEVTPFQQKIFDEGHRVEAAVRPMIEALVSDDLFPQVWADGKLSASCDGLTVDRVLAFECKQWNQELAAAIAAGTLPDSHMPQPQQIMLVTGAEKVIFACSDGTADKFVWMEVFPDPVWQQRILAGWVQFEADLATYQPVEVLPAPVAAPVMTLPALAVQIRGEIVASNLAEYEQTVTTYLGRLNLAPKTDQELVDGKAIAENLRGGAKAILTEADKMLETADIGATMRRIKLLAEQMNTAALTLEKAYDAEEANRKQKMIAEAVDALAAHVAGLNKRLGAVLMPPIAYDFVGAIKGLRNQANRISRINEELARCKAEANIVADRIQANLTLLNGFAERAYLFADRANLVAKAPEDLLAIIKTRIAEHDAEQARTAGRLAAPTPPDNVVPLTPARPLDATAEKRQQIVARLEGMSLAELEIVWHACERIEEHRAGKTAVGG